MSRAWIAVLASLALAVLASTVLPPEASAATPTRLALTAPTSVAVGEDIAVEVRLTTIEGQPVAGAALILSQVGMVGLRPMERATTDEKGAASFLHQEYTLTHLSLRVAFPGDARFGPSQADADVTITGLEAPPAVVMSHSPSPLVKGVLFAVLGGVWMTYVFAGSFVLRIVREGRRKDRVARLGR